MNHHQNRLKALRFDRPESIPVNVSILPAAWMRYRGELSRIVDAHPFIFGDAKRDRDYDQVGKATYVEGTHVDEWGCVWSNVKTGMEAIVTKHPLPTRESVRSMTIPERDTGTPHGFMFLRLADLRGFEELMIDFAEEPPELTTLIGNVLRYNMRQVKLRLERTAEVPSILYFGDDLGMQHGLAIDPEQWRKYLKPCFAQIYRPVKNAGHYVYMHTDGYIIDIIPDLIDCGVDVINPQVGANGLERLAAVCRGKVCVDLDLNRQKFPFWTPQQIGEHVREVVEVLGSPQGGLWIKAEIADDVPLENVAAICSALERHALAFS